MHHLIHFQNHSPYSTDLIFKFEIQQIQIFGHILTGHTTQLVEAQYITLTQCQIWCYSNPIY